MSGSKYSISHTGSGNFVSINESHNSGVQHIYGGKSSTESSASSSLSSSTCPRSAGPCFSTPNAHRSIPLKGIGNPKSHGLVLIINIYKYETDKGRKGSDLDCRRLLQTLSPFNLGIFIPDSDSYLKDELISHTHIAEWITEFQTKFESGCAKFSLVFVMGHGDEKNQLVDSHEIAKSLESSVFTRFNNANFPSMINKPKLFFMNCCRGEKLTPPVLKPDGMEHDQAWTVPTISDMLIFWSTTPGHFSIRDTQTGSIAVTTFCHKMEKYHNYLKENPSAATTSYDFHTAILQQVANEMREYVAKMGDSLELTQTTNIDIRTFGHFSLLLDDCTYIQDGKPLPF